jgi:hypothetical protein
MGPVSVHAATLATSNNVVVQVNAVLGPATRTHTIYEHIEVVVHPLGVHLTEAVATPFWVGDFCSHFCILLLDFGDWNSLHDQLTIPDPRIGYGTIIIILRSSQQNPTLPGGNVT